MDIMEFEGRIKKLVYCSEEVTLRQLQMAFMKDLEEYDDLAD
jgi:hypothetical protein